MPKRKFSVTTYGAPVASITQSDHRFRNPGDYVSILNRGAKTTGEEKGSLNPIKAHGYQMFDHTSETNSGGWVIDKHFQPQPQYNAPMSPME